MKWTDAVSYTHLDVYKRQEQLAVQLDDRHDYPLAADLVRRLMFLEKLLFEIDDAMAALEA